MAVNTSCITVSFPANVTETSSAILNNFDPVQSYKKVLYTSAQNNNYTVLYNGLFSFYHMKLILSSN